MNSAKNIVPKAVYFSSLRKLDRGNLSGRRPDRTESREGKRSRSYKPESLSSWDSHNHENVMAAAAMAYCAGVSVESIRKSVCEFVAVPAQDRVCD